MNTPTSSAVVQKVAQETPMKLGEEIEMRTDQFRGSLPAHIPVERFKKVLLVAVNTTPALVGADRRSFFNSALKAANDGLLPDGREGALVIYKTKVVQNGKDVWVDAVQWMPMIAGIRKKVRNSGEIATWDVKAVFEKDEFLYEEGLDPVLKHKPFLDGPAGELKAVYSVCKMKTGEVSLDVMPKWQVDRIRLLSKSKDKGPWVDHYVEMAKKTVARRHSKVLPMSTDLDDLIRRDDELYDMAGASDKNIAVERPKLQDFTDAPERQPMTENPKAEEKPAPQEEKHDFETGELSASKEEAPAEEEQSEFGAPEAMELGRQTRRDNRPMRKPEWPGGANDVYDSAWQAGYDEVDVELRGAAQKK